LINNPEVFSLPGFILLKQLFPAYQGFKVGSGRDCDVFWVKKFRKLVE
jgi:hypothetical protein